MPRRSSPCGGSATKPLRRLPTAAEALMFRSLRFRLPALFLLGIVLAGLVATLIAVRFFQSNTRAHAASALRAGSAGIVRLYQQKAGVGHVSLRSINVALGGDKVFWVPAAPGG